MCMYRSFNYMLRSVLQNESDCVVVLQSLQLASFMLSVCHVVLVVSDWFIDVDLVRFLKRAEMLKPPTPVSTNDVLSDDHFEHYPHIGGVSNLSLFFLHFQMLVSCVLLSHMFCFHCMQRSLSIGPIPRTSLRLRTGQCRLLLIMPWKVQSCATEARWICRLLLFTRASVRKSSAMMSTLFFCPKSTQWTPTQAVRIFWKITVIQVLCYWLLFYSYQSYGHSTVITLNYVIVYYREFVK